MAKRECPQCGSERATTVMLPSTAGSTDPRPHPAFRCMVCDTQWTDQDVRRRAESQDVGGRAETTTAEGSQSPPGPEGG